MIEAITARLCLTRGHGEWTAGRKGRSEEARQGGGREAANEGNEGTRQGGGREGRPVVTLTI